MQVMAIWKNNFYRTNGYNPFLSLGIVEFCRVIGHKALRYLVLVGLVEIDILHELQVMYV